MNALSMSLFAVLALGEACSQEVIATVTNPYATPASPVFQVLSESTVQQRDGSTITFRQVVPPVVTPQVLSTAVVAAPAELTAAEEAELSQMPVKETRMLSISASVKANGFTMLRWTCGASQRMHAVCNVDFRCLEGVGSLETEHASYVLILSAGPDDQAMADAEALAAQSLPVNGRASFALVRDGAAVNAADEETIEAIDAMGKLLDYYDAHREELTAQHAQREAERATLELAARNASSSPPRHSVIHFWPLQPAQRASINEQVRREAWIKAQSMTKGGKQP